jgi:nucleotide-binding universal stress UspA family protein
MSADEPAPILIGYDGHEDAVAAIARAGRLLAPRRAVVACVWNSFAALLLHSDVEGLTGSMREAAEEFDASGRQRAEATSEEGARLAREAGFDAEAAAVLGKPKAWPSLLELADERDAAAIVVGSEGMGALRSALFGSVSSGLLHNSRRPLLLVPRSAREEAGGPLILAYDGSDNAQRAIEVTAGLFPGREVVVQTVWTSYQAVAAASGIALSPGVAAAGAERIDAEMAERARQSAAEGARLAEADGLRAAAEPLREQGNTCRTLIQSARDHDAAAIVAGSRGRSAFSSALLGSVSAGLVHETPVPLLVVPPER